MPTAIRSQGIGDHIVTTGITLVPIAGEPAKPAPADRVDPDIVHRPDSSVDAHISAFELSEKVDTTMMQSPAPECENQFENTPPNRD